MVLALAVGFWLAPGVAAAQPSEARPTEPSGTGSAPGAAADDMAGKAAGSADDDDAGAATAPITDPEGDAQWMKETADSAASITAMLRASRYWAGLAALLTFIATTLLLHWSSSRWVRASWLQWFVLVFAPTAAVLAVMASSAASIGRRLEQMNVELLQKIPVHPVLGGEYGKTAGEALTLRSAADRGSLWFTLALQPGLIAAAVAFVAVLIVWAMTNKRVLKSV